MNNILFPTDFSPAAIQAFRYALGVASVTGAKITVFHAYQVPRITGGGNLPNTMKEAYDSMHAEAKEQFQKHFSALEEIAREGGASEVALHSEVVQGPAIESILKTARQMATDVIIMGTKGASGLREIFIGSIAGEVLEKAACPVLAIPEKATFDGAIDRLAVTTSFREEDKAALRGVLDFAQPFNAKVTCVNVDLAHKEELTHAKDVWQEEFAEHTNLDFVVIDGINFETAIAKFLDSNEIDILGMLTHKRTILQELFTFNRTKRMAYHSTTPILAFPA